MQDEVNINSVAFYDNILPLTFKVCKSCHTLTLFISPSPTDQCLKNGTSSDPRHSVDSSFCPDLISVSLLSTPLAFLHSVPSLTPHCCLW